MLKKIKSSVLLIVLLSFIMTSCYVTTFTVGKGAQGSSVVKGKNHFVIGGLFNIKTADPKQLAGGASDYTVTIKHGFIDILLQGVTFGIYSPTTTEVTK